MVLGWLPYPELVPTAIGATSLLIPPSQDSVGHNSNGDQYPKRFIFPWWMLCQREKAQVDDQKSDHAYHGHAEPAKNVFHRASLFYLRIRAQSDFCGLAAGDPVFPSENIPHDKSPCTWQDKNHSVPPPCVEWIWDDRYEEGDDLESQDCRAIRLGNPNAEQSHQEHNSTEPHASEPS